MSSKYSFVPEGFTRNEAGEVLKGTNERRKTVAGVLYQETKNIKRPKKNANVKQRKREIAESKNHYDGIITERLLLNKPYEEYCNENGHISFRAFENKSKVSKTQSNRNYKRRK